MITALHKAPSHLPSHGVVTMACESNTGALHHFYYREEETQAHRGETEWTKYTTNNRNSSNQNPIFFWSQMLTPCPVPYFLPGYHRWKDVDW